MTTARVAGVDVDTRHWIDGERVASQDTFEDVSPLDGQVIAHVSRAGQAEVDAAVAAAKTAFPAWAALPPTERATILRRVADGVEARIEDLAQVETRDNGSLLRSHRRGVMPRVAMNIRFFADHLLELSHPDFDTRGHRNHVSWDPAGVTAIVTPWNAPLMLATWRIGPALAAGNTVVAKPPEWAPLTASLVRGHRARGRSAGGRVQCRPGHGRRGRRPAGGPPRRAPDLLHRFGADVGEDRRGGGP